MKGDNSVNRVEDMKTRSVLNTLIEYSGMENRKCREELKALFRDGEREYYVNFSNDRLMFECYGWDGLLLCAFVSKHFPESWEFVEWRFAFDSFAELTDRILSGASSQDLIAAFKSKTRELESRLGKITDIIEKHEQKENE